MLRAILSAALAVAFSCGAAFARTTGTEPIRTSSPLVEAGATDGSLSPDARFALAATNTTLLASFSFDVGATCSQQGWTVVDATAQVGEFWHVDDFVGANVNPGDSLAVLAGTKSLWCGLRAATNGLACSYLVLPGYGNNWNQLWQTKTCIPVTGPLDVSFLLEIDSEPGYDYVFLEYTTDCTPPFTAWRNVGGSSWIYWDGQLRSDRRGRVLFGGWQSRQISNSIRIGWRVLGRRRQVRQSRRSGDRRQSRRRRTRARGLRRRSRSTRPRRKTGKPMSCRVTARRIWLSSPATRWFNKTPARRT